MVTLKFLVTGSAGLIGNQLVNDLSKSHDLISCYNNSKPEFGIPMNMDLQNHEMISNILREAKPDVVGLTSTSGGTINSISPPIKVYKNSTVEFDLSDQSLGYVAQSTNYPAFVLNFY